MIIPEYMEDKKKKEERGVYHNDYSPRYQPAYDIYEKARQHIKMQKKHNRLKNEKEEKESM